MTKRSCILSLISLVLLSGTAFGLYKFGPQINDYFYRQEIAQENEQTIKEIHEIIETPPQQSTEENLPPKAYLEAQFICQAPLETEANWTLHEESCEEAAVLMAYNFENKKTVTKEEANQIILDMIEWQRKNFGGHHDLYADDLKTFITGFYGLTDDQVEITYDASIDDLKKQINTGHPVIVPITGEILKNPYYPYPGYHMLLVTGYTEDRIITNDNGTRRGKDFSYDASVFEAAMKDAGGDILIINKNSASL